MILRARVKREEDLAGVCCERMKASLLAFQREIHVVTRVRLKKTDCMFCKKPFLGMRIYGMRGWRINPKWWEFRLRGSEVEVEVKGEVEQGAA